MHPSCLDWAAQKARALLLVQEAGRMPECWMLNPQCSKIVLRAISLRFACNPSRDFPVTLDAEVLWHKLVFQKTMIKWVFGIVLTSNGWIQVHEFHFTFPAVVEVQWQYKETLLLTAHRTYRYIGKLKIRKKIARELSIKYSLHSLWKN